MVKKRKAISDDLKHKALKKLFDHLYNDRKQNAKNDHGCNGKIEFEICFFNADITGQPAYPLQFI